MNKNIRIAIQKSGRLHDDSMRLLKECGIDVGNSRNQLKVTATNFPAELFFLRDDDIPEYVQDGVADIGFVGENVVLEKNKKVSTIEKLGFGKCRLSIAVPNKKKIKLPQDLAGKKIATSYPNILSAYLKKQKIKADIHTISGSVEIAPKIGLADAICDLVSSGNTLFSNELVEMETILQSEAVIISTPDLATAQQQLLQKLLFRIQSVKRSRNNKYVLLNAPNSQVKNICQLLPGMRSATVLPLAEEGWSSIHSVINETDFWNIIEKLKQYGAEGILVIPIEKMIL
jgi:ATP phosphoribosyltransferase